jgi:hypothetical protein
MFQTISGHFLSHAPYGKHSAESVLSSKQRVAGSNPAWDATFATSMLLATACQTFIGERKATKGLTHACERGLGQTLLKFAAAYDLPLTTVTTEHITTLPLAVEY